MYLRKERRVFKLDRYIRKIDIQLDNGIYVYNYLDSVGKTYLAKLLHQYRAIGEPVVSYTYTDFCVEIKPESVLIPGKYKVIAIDRYDMFHSREIDELMYKFARGTIILVDCKDDMNRPIYDGIVSIELEKEWIRVY